MTRDRASRPEAKPLRLFVALEIPERAKGVVERAFRPWRERFPRARWVPAEDWHVTLKFMGATSPRLVDRLHESITEVALQTAAFDTRLADVGAFPSLARARVVWAGLEDQAGRLASLADALEECLAREFPAERRAFHPHVTVARSEPPLHLPDEFASVELRSDRFPVDHMVLFRSHQRRPTPVYEPLVSFPFVR